MNVTFAHNYKLKLTPRQQQLIEAGLVLGFTDLYNFALKELELDIRRLKKLPKPGEFKKYYADHRNESKALQLFPTQASQSVYDKLIQSYKNTLEKERLKIAGEFYKNNISKDLPDEQKKILKNELKNELNEFILLETIKKFQPKNHNNPYSTICFFEGQYTPSFDQKQQFLGVSILHGAQKFKEEPHKKIGFLKVFKSGKPFYGKLKRIEIVKKIDGYYLCCSIEAGIEQIPKRPQPLEESSVGIDFGNKHCLTLSDGTKLDKFDPKTKKTLKKLWSKKEAIQKILSKKQDAFYKINKITEGIPNSNSYNKYLKKLQMIDLDITRIREFKGHSLTNKVLDNYNNIYVEDIKTAEIMEKQSDMKSSIQKAMKRNISHNSWGALKEQFIYKGNWRGNNIVLVPAKNTTQTCSGCGHIRTAEEKLTLKDRIHNCAYCGLILDRDINAAKNIENYRTSNS